MPTSARKSSIGGARNRTQKAHIPYRGDNPEVGKRTGIAVQHVERKSDGFEPFAELLQQADGRTPPRPKIRKKSLANAGQRAQDDYFDDEDGEMSMQLDSPVHHLVNMRPPTTPPTAGRRSSIRPVARTSDVDFDKIPSPRPFNASQRANRNAAPGPSSLSRSILARDVEPDSDSPNEDAGDYYDDNTQHMDDGGFDDYAQDNTPTQASVANHSFSRIDADDDDDEEEGEEEQELGLEPEPPKPTKKKPPPPPREPSQSEDEEVEAEIAQGLEDVGLGPDSADEEEEEEEAPPPPKKTKVVSEKKPTSRTKTESRGKKENRPEREGVRRSNRTHYPPLEYWRGERVEWGRDHNAGPILVPHIKKVVRIPVEQPEPLGAKRKRGSTRARSRSRAIGAEEDQIAPVLPVANPEEGWDDDTPKQCMVIHYTSREEVERPIACTGKMVKPRAAADGSWSFDKIFGDDEFIAAGQLIIPPKGVKPSKGAKDNTYIFYVIEGAVNFKIHKTNMVLTTGGMFMVPRGNTYLIENISNRTAKMFFTQARKMDMNDEERAVKAQRMAEIQRRKSLVRSSSAGAPAGARTALSTSVRSKSLVASTSTRKA